MKFLSTARLVVTIATAAVAAGACSGQVSEGGSETNWLCSVDSDCRAGERCVEKRCEGVGGASTALPEPDAGVRVGAGGASSSPGQSTTQFTDVLTAKGDPAICTQETCFYGRCLPLVLERDETGHLPCAVIDVVAGAGSACDSTIGLLLPPPKRLEPAKNLLRERGKCDVAGTPACSSMTYCERAEATGSELQSCLNDGSLPVGSLRWCYIGPANGLGSPDVVAQCQGTERRLLRFPPFTSEHILVIACSISSGTPASPATRPGKLGDPFVPGDETRPEFSGYSAAEISIENRTPSCESGVGIIYGFSGRVGCPYGQPADRNDPTHVDPSLQTCFTPGGAAVTVPVREQSIKRPPAAAVYCSCRCDGPDTNAAYCACPGGFECKKLVDDYGFGSAQLAGSFCIKSGTTYSPGAIAEAVCDRTAANCENR